MSIQIGPGINIGGGISVSVTNSLPPTPASEFLKVSYVDLLGAGSFSQIAANAWTQSNFIIAGFVDFTTNTPSSTIRSGFNTIANNVAANTEILFSLGGATYDGTTINTGTANAIIANTVAQITTLNATLAKPITGVDLDLENGITAQTVTNLVNGFKAQGYTVCIAPQIIATSGTNINVATPNNLGLSSGGASNQYGAAVASGNVDYIFTQNYNSGGFTIGGVGENNLIFLGTSTQAIANCYSSGYQVNIPANTKVITGTVVNTGAAFNVNNMFGVAPGNAYTQSTTLNNLNIVIATLRTQNLGNAFAGIGAWSLNNDYLPTAYGDNWAVPGAYTNTIYGPTAPASL